MKQLQSISFIFLISSMLGLSALQAEETPLSVSVLSNDAKFVGSSMGGMQITIRDFRTGALLSTGLTKGSTGDTARIMTNPHERDFVLRSEGSARFDTVLDLDRPTKVTIKATGPLAQGQSLSTVTETWTLLPGKDYSAGNGILLRLHGMVVDVLAPPAHLKTSDAQPLEVAVNVTKMCGCPVGEDTPWPVERYEVEARIYKAAGDLIKVVPLSFAGERSQFEGPVSLPDSGTYEIVVTAFDPKSKDSGVDTTTVIVTDE